MAVAKKCLVEYTEKVGTRNKESSGIQITILKLISKLGTHEHKSLIVWKGNCAGMMLWRLWA